MPSLIVGAQSGGVPLVSGCILSGNILRPTGGIQLIADAGNSGTVYVGLSGGVTITSGGGSSSGGMFDGLPVVPGALYFIPKMALVSGQPNVWLTVPPGVSGFCRIYWQSY